MGIGERLKEARKSFNISQDNLADKIGVSRGVITNIEHEKTEPTLLVVNAICDVLNVSKEWLLNGTGEMCILSKEDDELMKAIAEISLSDNEKLKRIVSNLMKLDEQYIDSINTIIDGLVKK